MMNITLKGINKNIAVIQNNSLLIADLQSAVDFAMTVNIEVVILMTRCGSDRKK